MRLHKPGVGHGVCSGLDPDTARRFLHNGREDETSVDGAGSSDADYSVVYRFCFIGCIDRLTEVRTGGAHNTLISGEHGFKVGDPGEFGGPASGQGAIACKLCVAGTGD